MAFSEGAQFRDILLVAEKSKPHSEDIIGVVFLKKSIREMALGDSSKIAEKIREIPCKMGISKNTDFDIYFETYDELCKLEDNLMPILGASYAENIDVFTHFLNLLRTRGKTKLKYLSTFDIREGFHASPAGLSQLTFITRETSTDRTKRAFLIITNEEGDNVEATVKDSNLIFKIPKGSLLPALRTLTSVESFYVGKNRDYFVKEEFEGFGSLLSFSKWKDKKGFDWDSVRKRVEDKATYLALARRFRPNSKSTHFFAFFSNEMFISPHTFKILRVSEEEGKLQSLFLNSVISLLCIITLREQTTEGFTDIMESDLNYFTTVNSSKLSEKEMQKLDSLFQELKDVKFPSIVEQLEKRHWARLKLDEAVLSIIGFSKEEINEWLPKVYDALVRELKAI